MDAADRHRTVAAAAYRQARVDVALSHVSSLLFHGTDWWDLPLDEVHLTRLDGRIGRRQAGIRPHAGRVLPGDVDLVGEVAIMSPARTVLEVATLVDFERALVVANAMLHAGKTTRRQLEDRSVDMYLWPDTLRHERVLMEADGRLESVGETRTWCALRRAGLPRPTPQFEVYVRGRLVARLDFAWPELGVWLEFDGKVKYLQLLKEGERPTDVVLREKAREAKIARITGWRCERADWHDLNDPRDLIARVSTAMSAGVRGA
jgi:hypothetical protein